VSGTQKRRRYNKRRDRMLDATKRLRYFMYHLGFTSEFPVRYVDNKYMYGTVIDDREYVERQICLMTSQ
jgi:hypothetical protein